MKIVNQNVAITLQLLAFYQMIRSFVGPRLTQMSGIRNSLMDTIGPLIAIAIGIVVVVLIAAMSIIGGQNSANLISATANIGLFMGVIGVGIGLAAFLKILDKI
jgi:hypothetical protein